MRRAVYMLLAGALVWAAVPQSGGEIGSALPAWSPGMLDIHHISTGRGNSAFFVLPDGTTLLVDAGASGSGVPETDPHPDASRTPGAWIARYIQRHLPPRATTLDYALITHFHPDHMGQVLANSPDAADGSYKLTGITEVDSAVPIHTLVDRGWPDYSYPAPIKDATMANYRSFLEARRKKGMTVERFQPGARSQFRLRYNAAQFPFEIRNIIANGEVWTGTGEAKRALFPPLDAHPAGRLAQRKHVQCGNPAAVRQLPILHRGRSAGDRRSRFPRLARAGSSDRAAYRAGGRPRAESARVDG